MDNKVLDQVHAEYEEVNATLGEVREQLKEHREQVEAKVDRYGDLSNAQKGQIDDLLKSQGELKARLDTAEQIIAEGTSTLKNAMRPKSLGEAWCTEENIAGVKRLIGTRGQSFAAEIERPVNVISGDTAAAGGAAVDESRVPGITPLGERRFTIRDALPVAGVSETNAVEFVQETGFTNNAAPVSENPASAKPESNITFALQQAPVATIAHWIHASKQILSDASMMQGYIDRRLRYGLALEEEEQILLGSGATVNVNGLVTQATAYSNPGVTVTNDTLIDRLRIALLQVEQAEYMADTIVLNSQDWAELELTKDQNALYILSSPQNGAIPRLWGYPVIKTNTMTQGTWLVGAMQMGAQLWDRETVNVSVATQADDDFTKNMIKVLVEERIALTVYRPEAFVTGNTTIGSAGA